MTTIGNLTFDTTRVVAAPVVHGYDRASRAALADDTLIKVRDLATRSNLDGKLTKGLQVTSYNPSDLKDSNNFFNFVSTWEGVILSIETHLKTYFMETPFTIVNQRVTEPTEAERRAYEFDLLIFLSASSDAGGTAESCDETLADGTVVTNERPVPPTGTVALVEVGNLLRDWHNITLAQVVESMDLILKHVNDAVDRQNLSWTFQYLLDSLDSDMKAFVLSKISHLDPGIGRTGPVVFKIMADRLLQTTENLAQKVINGFIALRLTHFDGENVVEAIFTVRNVLKFLRYGEANSYAPRTTIQLIYDVFRGSTVGAFRAYIQQAQDIVLKDETNVELIFDHIQKKFEELILADRWVPSKKKPSAFHMSEPKTRTFAEADNGGKPAHKDNAKAPKKEDGQKERPTHDKSGKKIDYNPPKNNEPHTRTRDDKTEYWCGTCGRWGSHLTDKHDEWRKNFRKNRRKNNGNGNNDNNANAASTPAAPTESTRARGSVTFLSAATGASTNFTVDPDLADGIDFE